MLYDNILTKSIKDIPFQAHNIHHTQIKNVCIWSGEKLPQTLFIADADIKSAIPSDIPLLLTDSDSVFPLVCEIQKLLLCDVTTTLNLHKLFETPSVSFSILVKQLTHIIGLPFAILDANFNTLGNTFPGNVALPSHSNFKNTIKNWDKENTVIFKNYEIHRIVKEEKVTGYLITLADHSAFPTMPLSAFPEPYIRFSVKALAQNNLFQSKNIFQLSDSELFLKSILDDQLSDSETIHLNFNETLAPKGDKYYLLIVEIKNLSGRQLKTALTSIFQTKVWEYRSYCVMIWSYSFTEQFSIHAYPEFQKFLKKYQLHAALSNGFLDSALLRNAYLQCLDAIRLFSRLYPDEYFSQYDEIIVSHLIDISSKHNISLKGLIHPSVLWIQKYDKENNTQYLQTLITYISQNYNISRTAVALNLHRNTVYMQIKYLKEYFLIDFDNYKMQYKIQISVTVLCNLGLSNVDKFIGYDHAD